MSRSSRDIFRDVLGQLKDESTLGNLGAVRRLYAEAEAQNNALTRPGNLSRDLQFPLHYAVQNGRLTVVSFLLSKGASIMDVTKELVVEGPDQILELFLEQGLDLNEPVQYAQRPPPLMFVVNSIELTKRLLRHGANPNAPNPLDVTPLSHAVEFGSRGVIELLFAQGGDLDHGQLLHYAARRQLPDRLAVAEDLLRRGADPNATMFANDTRSYRWHMPYGLGTPLHDAANFGSMDVAMLLLFWGTDWQAKDSRKKLAWENAEYHGHVALTQLLRSPPSRIHLWYWLLTVRVLSILNRMRALLLAVFVESKSVFSYLFKFR